MTLFPQETNAAAVESVQALAVKFNKIPNLAQLSKTSWQIKGRPGHHLHLICRELGINYDSSFGSLVSVMDLIGVEESIRLIKQEAILEEESQKVFDQAVVAALQEIEELKKPTHRKRWAYGITTVRQRLKDELPRTIASLKDAGFDKPRLFIDGEEDGSRWKHFGLEMTTHFPALRTFSNWFLALQELYSRNPQADTFAIFQDDFVTYKNLRSYLNYCPYPDRGYWNLFTVPLNQNEFREQRGWFPAIERGAGAVALVFNKETAETLLTHPYLVKRPNDCLGWRNVDGGIYTALGKLGWKEYVHSPSLVEHTGILSSMLSKPQPKAGKFLGEDFDAMDLLK